MALIVVVQRLDYGTRCCYLGCIPPDRSPFAISFFLLITFRHFQHAERLENFLHSRPQPFAT